MSADRDLAQLQSQFRIVARQGMQACELLERGQAEMPLSDHFRSVSEGLDSRAFSAILVGLTLEARSSALAWLCGQDFRIFAVQVPREVGLVKLLLQDRGYVLEKGDGARQEFDRLEPFLDALKQADLVRHGDAESWISPLQLRVAAPPGLQGLQLHMPENPAALTKSPTLLKSLLSASNLIVLAGPPDAALPEAERRALLELVESMDAVLPVVMAPDSPLPRSGWWNDRTLSGSKFPLPPVVLADGRPAELPGLFTNPRDGLRESLFLSQQTRLLLGAAEMVNERYQDEQRRLAAKQSAAARKIRSLEEAGRDQDARSQIDAVRMSFLDETAKLVEGLKELNRKGMLPAGKMTTSVREVADRLESADLRQETVYSTIRLSVDDGFLRGLADRTKEIVKSQLRDDMILLRDGLEALREPLSAKLSEVRGAPVNVDLPLPDERKLWESLREMIAVEINYHGELPKRGFWQRLLEGRQRVMMILMFFSMFGGAFGFSQRAVWVTFPMIGLFLWGVIHTYVAWKHEDRDRLVKELERVKESILAEARRLLEESVREKLTRIGAYLEDLKKEVVRRIDEVARETVKTRSDTLEADRQESRSRMRTLEQRTRELQSYGQQFLRLSQGCGELDQACRRLLSDASRAPMERRPL